MDAPNKRIQKVSRDCRVLQLRLHCNVHSSQPDQLTSSLINKSLVQSIQIAGMNDKKQTTIDCLTCFFTWLRIDEWNVYIYTCINMCINIMMCIHTHKNSRIQKMIHEYIYICITIPSNYREKAKFPRSEKTRSSHGTVCSNSWWLKGMGQTKTSSLCLEKTKKNRRRIVWIDFLLQNGSWI